MLRPRFALSTLLAALTLAAMCFAAARYSRQLGARQEAAIDAAHNISGFHDFYCEHEIERIEGAFPKLEDRPDPLPGWVYRLIPPEYLHEFRAVAVDLPDDRVQELVPLAEHTRLRVLEINWPRYFDDELRHFAAFEDLEYLRLSYATNLTDAGLDHLARLPRLKVLDLTGGEFSEEALARLRRALPECKVIYPQRDAERR